MRLQLIVVQQLNGGENDVSRNVQTHLFAHKDYNMWTLYALHTHDLNCGFYLYLRVESAYMRELRELRECAKHICMIVFHFIQYGMSSGWLITIQWSPPPRVLSVSVFFSDARESHCAIVW